MINNQEKIKENIQIIESISNILPVKYNGITEQYELCEPNKSDGYIIFYNDQSQIIIKKCENINMLIDII